jgi:hypothetical protein
MRALNLSIVSTLAGSLLVFGSVAMAAPAASGQNSLAKEQRVAAKLLKDIRMDARAIDTHARRMVAMSSDNTTKWSAFDKQWNEIKPSEEDIQLKLNKLQPMRASLSPSQQKALAAIPPLYDKIASTARDVRAALNPGAGGIERTALREHSAALANDSMELGEAVAPARTS